MSSIINSLAAIFLSTGLSALAQDTPPCFSNADFRDIGDLTQYIHKTTDYYEGTPRIPLDNMATSAQQKYAATGKIQCNGYKGSAQLTVKNNLITTAGHILTGRNDCKSRARATDCEFIIRSHGRDRTIKVSRLVGTGFRCPTLPEIPDDWAVMQLAESVDDVQPYSIDPAKVRALRRGDQVVTVARSADFVVNHKNVMHYGQCSILNTYGTYSAPTGFSTACGCSKMCSGGSLLSADSASSLLGIVVEDFEKIEDLMSAIKKGKPNIAHWKEDGSGTYYTPLSGEFLRTIDQASRDVSI